MAHRHEFNISVASDPLCLSGTVDSLLQQFGGRRSVRALSFHKVNTLVPFRYGGRQFPCDSSFNSRHSARSALDPCPGNSLQYSDVLRGASMQAVCVEFLICSGDLLAHDNACSRSQLCGDISEC